MAPRAKDEEDADLHIASSREEGPGADSSRGNSSQLSHVEIRSKMDATIPQQQKHTQEQSNKDNVMWWIHGQPYDLQRFVGSHPGGKEAILLGKGRDCTALVESYHPFGIDRVQKVLDKYAVVTNRNRDDDRDNDDIFYKTLQQRVAVALNEVGIDPIRDRGATKERALYYFVIFVAWAVSGYWHVQASILGSFVFAIFGWLMGALGHDAGHFAASRVAAINEWGVWAMSLICNPVQWQQQHTYGHHSFTNEFDHDPDLHHWHNFLRVHERIPHSKIFELQIHWLFVVFAYGWTVFGTCVWIPWGVIQTGALYTCVEWHDKYRPGKAIGMRLHLLLYVGIILALPFWTHNSMWQAAAAVTVHVSTLGIVFAIFSQVNHLNEPSLMSDMDSRQRYQKQDPRLSDSWAAAQVETSNNFASGSLVWHVLSNGLNHQIEHHLFPGLNHCHLHHIAPVVRKTCKEFGVDYKSFDSWSEIMAATCRWYDQLAFGGILPGSTKKTE